MSFFGFEDHSNNALEQEKRKFLEGNGGGEEEIAVYNWGESDYDGLGDALQEGGDELNDETFGGSGPVGKDFDFAQSTPHEELPRGNSGVANLALQERGSSPYRSTPVFHDTLLHRKQPSAVSAENSSQKLRNGGMTRDVSFDQRHPTGRVVAIDELLPSMSHDSHRSQSGIRTLEEIEAEMRAKQQKHQKEQLLLQQRQEEELLLQQQQEEQLLLQQQDDRWRRQEYGTLPLHMEPQRRHIPDDASINFAAQRTSDSLLPPRLAPRPDATPILQQHSSFSQQVDESDEMEHELRMMHIAQLQHRQAQRQEQRLAQQEQFLQQQQLYQSGPIQQVEEQSFYSNASRIHPHPTSPDPAFVVRPQTRSPAPVSFLPPPQNQRQLHMQQQLLAQLTQSGLHPDQIPLLDPQQRDMIMNEAMRKIVAAERLEQKNRRRFQKIDRMSKYNDLMTQSDKDFITRIQVSQLVSSDPWSDDFYAQIIFQLRRSGMAPGWTGLGFRTGRREHAMKRMAEQVSKIVENAKARDREKGHDGAVNPLQGVLGKTSGRSYKAAPRQLLQVGGATPGPRGDSPATSPHLTEAPGNSTNGIDMSSPGPDKKMQDATKEPLTRRQTLALIERLYELSLEWENLQRRMPELDSPNRERWDAQTTAIELQIWDSSQITVPLETSYPHPLVSLLGPLKGKKVMKRLTRVMDTHQSRIALTLVTRLFRDLDVVANFHITETFDDSRTKHETEQNVHAFEEFVLDPLLPALATAPLPLVSGQLQHLKDPVAIARTRPGLILLTHILTRASIIKDKTLILAGGGDVGDAIAEDIATMEDFHEWQHRYDIMFESLAPHFVSLFPSSRYPTLPTTAPPESLARLSVEIDAADHPVWSFFASMGILASMEQQSVLVSQLREKILENVFSATQGWVANDNQRLVRLQNVNTFLHALGLDSSQINL